MRSNVRLSNGQGGPTVSTMMKNDASTRELRAAEFFAGIGLVRRAMEEHGVRVVFANDIDPLKRLVYVANFGDDDFHLGDIAQLPVEAIPDVDIATASFPCTDLSLAGSRAGLDGAESGTFWFFADVLEALGPRRPRAILLENVGGLGTSRQGEDLRAAIARLNGLGYSCDLVQLNALRWVPQSRPRVFVIGTLEPVERSGNWGPDELRPAWISRFVERNADLAMEPVALTLPHAPAMTLADYIERLPAANPLWWDVERVERFVTSLSVGQLGRLINMRAAPTTAWRTAYRRTRQGKPVWEIRPDDVSGCLRTSRGGSSRQAVVEAGHGRLGVRWMTAREYAGLMGAADHLLDTVSENQAIFGLGDAVCVPAVSWLVRAYLVPLALGELSVRQLVAVGAA